MTMRSAFDVLNCRVTFWLVALVIALLFSVTNLPWTLDDYDQAKQAFTSFEMVNEGHWFFQHTPNEKIATKPPLVGWVSAATYGTTRSWELAWRLPSIAAVIALLTVLTRAATNAYGTMAGLIAMSAFGLNLLSPRLATLVRTDMPLALVTFLLGLKIWQRMRKQERKPQVENLRHELWSTRDRSVMFILLTAAMLIKGPIVYAFLLPGIVAFQWWKRGSGDRVNPWCGWWPWIGSLAVFLAWVAAGIAWVPGFYEQVVLREFAGRFGETVHRPQPIYFYFPHLLHKFAPWSILILAFAAMKLRGKKVGEAVAPRLSPGHQSNESKTIGTPRPLPHSPEIAWLICWSLGGLVVMSLIPSKRMDRIFPILPPLCLLVAALLSHLSTNRDLAPRVMRWSAVALIFAGLFTSVYAAQRLVVRYRSGDSALIDFGAAVRSEAATNRWRYEVVGGEEEGLLLYLRRTRFFKAEEVIKRWNAGLLDAVVVPAEESARMHAQLRGSVPAGLEASVKINARPRRYLLLKKSQLL